MDKAYWDSQISYLQNNKPKSSDSYYNQSFVDKINEARTNIDNLVAEKDKAWSAANQAHDTYNAFRGDMTSYGDVYKGSKSEFGIEDHQDTYEKSKKALALAESTLEALPSSINSSSNRVLTQSQREDRYNVLSDRMNRYRSNLEGRTSMYEEAWKNAREAAATYASETMTGQWSKLDSYNQAWMTALNNYNNVGDRLARVELELRKWQDDYRTWQRNQYSQAMYVWSRQLDHARDARWEAIQTNMANAEANSAMRIADIEKKYAEQGAARKEARRNASVNKALALASDLQNTFLRGGAGGGGGGGGW